MRPDFAFNTVPAAEQALASLPARISGAARAVLPAISDAANRAGVDFSALFKMARVESDFRPEAKAGTSSATGLFQFIDSTWLQMLDKHGPAHGIRPQSREQALQLRKDPAIASLMAARHMADNVAALERSLGRNPDETDLYLAHFLGIGGATRFLQRMDQDPDFPGAELLPSAAKSNRNIFYANGTPRSLSEIRNLLHDRLNAGFEAVTPGNHHATQTRLPVPQSAPSLPVRHLSASHLPAMLSAQIAVAAALDPSGQTLAELAARNDLGASTSVPAEIQSSPALAARFAYLLLAELGA